MTYFHGYDHKYIETTDDYYNISMKVGKMSAELKDIEIVARVNRSANQIIVELN